MHLSLIFCFFEPFIFFYIIYSGDTMFNFFLSMNPILQSFLAGSFTFFITLLGSAVIFLFKKENENIMDAMMALSAGIMIAASFFSLLNPAIEIANSFHLCTWLILFTGFLIGGIFLFFGDKMFSYYSNGNNKHKRSFMIFLSITLHNIPEGLVLGVAFASIPFTKNEIAAFLSAIILTIGIATQNFPEGSAISLPLHRDGFSKRISFILGSLSAIVEPIFAIVGAILILKIQMILPFIMSFTAGAMIFVTLEELIPETQKNKRKALMSLLIMFGFCIMMVLELCLG